MARTKKQKWFVKIRGSYLPQTWQGWLTYVPFIAFLMTAVVYACNTSDNLIEALYLIFPQWVAGAVIMTWIAAQKS